MIFWFQQSVLEPLIGADFNITKAGFLLFFACSLLIYYLCPIKYRWGVLLASSLAFFWCIGNGFVHFPKILAIGAIVYVAGIVLDRPNIRQSGHLKAITLFAGIVLLFGSLVFFRCWDFFVTTDRVFGRLFDIRLGLHSVSMIAPFGIAYFALTSISYLTDVYRGVILAEKNPLKIYTYIFFWPCMTCGPILRYAETGTGTSKPSNAQPVSGIENLSSIFEPHRLSYRNIAFGAQRILWGFFKKIVVADRLSILVNTVYSDPAQYQGFYILVALFFFGIQLYCDFSGCLDIVIGAAQMYGIRLPENFNAPFFSRSFSEFFRRWHITLGLWGKDYLMYPLMRTAGLQRFARWLKGKKKNRFRKDLSKKLPVYIGIFATWFVIGFWHGGSYRYIICAGIIPAFFMIFGDLLAPLGAKAAKLLRFNTENFSYSLFQNLRTVGFVYFGVWLMFAADSLHGAIAVIKSLFTIKENFNIWVILDNETLYSLGIDRTDMGLMFIAIAVVFAVEIMHHRGLRIREFIAKQNLPFRWIVYLAAFFAVVILGVYGPSYDATDFIYRG